MLTQANSLDAPDLAGTHIHMPSFSAKYEKFVYGLIVLQLWNASIANAAQLSDTFPMKVLCVLSTRGPIR